MLLFVCLFVFAKNEPRTFCVVIDKNVSEIEAKLVSYNGFNQTSDDLGLKFRVDLWQYNEKYLST